MTSFDNLATQIKDFQKGNPLTASFNQLRDEAYTRLLGQGAPSRKTESWKYTNINFLFEKNYSFKGDNTQYNLNELKNDQFDCLFFINGKLNDLSDKTPFEISDFSDESLKVINANSGELNQDFAYNLNEATMACGAHFKLADNTQSKKPILIYHLVSGQNTLQSFHSTFHIGKNSEVEVLEVYLSEGDSESLANFATSIVLEQNAKFTHLHHQSMQESTIFFNNIRAQVAKDANYQSFTITLGAKLSRQNIAIDLNAEGASCVAHGAYTLQNSQHSDVNSFINHKAAHTQSEQLYKGIMGDKSRGVFTGLIKVSKDAQLINSSQLNKNLLLGARAQANSRPQLEIFADDVKCSHGSTTGQLSDDELFYFESRGIRAQKARMMLARAYTYDVLLKIDNLAIRKFIQTDITQKFEANAFGEIHA